MKKLISIFLIIAMTLSLATACSNSAPGASNTPVEPADAEKEQEEKKNDEPVVYRFTERESVSSYNPGKAEKAIEYQQLQWVNGQLYQRIYLTEEGKSDFIPELADGEPIQLDDTMTKWQIKVKEGRKYADGTPITAHSFYYSFKALADPKLANRNYQSMHVIKNADKYYLGEIEWEEVGMKVVDDYTLEFEYVEEKKPITAWDVKELFGYVGFGLVHEKTYEACYNADRTENSYGTTIDKIVASGAYKPVKLIDGQYTEYEKWIGGSPFAEEFYNVDTIQVSVVADNNTAIQMFKSGEIDMVVADSAEFDEYPDLYYNYTPDTYGIFLNSKSTTNPILANDDFRYALYWGLDRDKVVPVVFKTARPSGYHYSLAATVPDPEDPNKSITWRSLEEESKYAENIKLDGHKIENNGFNESLAKEYFDKAYAANGNKKIGVEMQYIEDNVNAKAFAEALQDWYQNMFGTDKLEIKLRTIPVAMLYENLKRDNLNYEIMAGGGVYQDITRPWANSNYVSSGDDVYSSQYVVMKKNPAEWDDLYYKCTVGELKYKPEDKNQATARMEEILYEEATYLPCYNRGVRVALAGHIVPIIDGNVGDPFLELSILQAEHKSRE